MLVPAGVLQQQANNQLPIPSDGLLFMLDGSVADSFYSDAARTTAATQGGPCGAWEDQSGNGNHWTQSNNSLRPTCQKNNNRLLVPGDGGAVADYYLIGPSLVGLTGLTFAARLETATTGTPSQGAIWGVTTWNSSQSLNHWQYSGTHYVTLGGTSRGTAFTWASIPENLQDPMNYMESMDSAAYCRAYVNGTERYAADLGTLSLRSNPALGCGIRSGTFQYSGQFYFYKFVGYNRTLTADERTSVNSWLSS